MKSPARLLFTLFVLMNLFIIYHVASNYLAERSAKNAAVEEFWRRERLAPEQRIAEDKAKADAITRAEKEEEWARLRAERAEKIARQQAEEKEFEATGRAVCLAWWKQSLRDPDSAKVEEAGGVFSHDTYYGHITGRAKNGFGGYVRATWDCQLTRNGKNYIPLSLTQRH